MSGMRIANGLNDRFGCYMRLRSDKNVTRETKNSHMRMMLFTCVVIRLYGAGISAWIYSTLGCCKMTAVGKRNQLLLLISAGRCNNLQPKRIKKIF